MMTGLVFTLLLALYYYNKKKPLDACDEYTSSGRSILSIQCPKNANTVHLFLRVLSFLWWFGLGWVGKWIRDAPLPKYYMFTVWNIIFMSIYFFFASLCSFQYRHDPDNKNENFPLWWNKDRRNTIAKFIRVAHSVIGGCAIFVTITAWKGSLGFWGLQQHLTNLLIFLIEGSQVVYVPNVVHFCFTGIFLYCYICFVWIIVKVWRGQKWPYPFLETSGEAGPIFFTYFGVLVLNIASFGLWMLLGHCKVMLYSYLFDKDFTPPVVLRLQREGGGEGACAESIELTEAQQCMQ